MMRAMILAAGRGLRMGELTTETPKPLLEVGGNYLIAHVILQLKKANIHDIVINISYLAEKIQNALGDGSDYGINIRYSIEETALETGGGIVKALPLLGHDPFIVVSSDVITDFRLNTLPVRPIHLAHLVMVDNPIYHPAGDFGLKDNRLSLDMTPRFTFANIGVYDPKLFINCKPHSFRLRTLLDPAIKAQQISAEYYPGYWFNVGTPEDLQQASAWAAEQTTLI